jgi:hypothetical protein
MICRAIIRFLRVDLINGVLLLIVIVRRLTSSCERDRYTCGGVAWRAARLEKCETRNNNNLVALQS